VGFFEAATGFFFFFFTLPMLQDGEQRLKQHREPSLIFSKKKKSKKTKLQQLHWN
jgi:hypothetical protein